MSIPVVDFGACSLDVKNVTDDQLISLGAEIKSALTQVGFVYLKNTGITDQEVDRVMRVSEKFFLQPEELKRPFKRGTFSNSPNHGWVSLETERLNPGGAGDLKEAFNVTSLQPDIPWPSPDSLSDFQEIQTSIFLRCRDLGLRIMRIMALSLDLDPQVFLGAHSLIGTDENASTLRSLYYPPVNREEAKVGQVRCGEHSDYGSITLLFQSSEGLEVRKRSGEFIRAPCVPGAVLINIADLMQRWTSDHFISVVHRVLLPPAGDSSTRQSLAFFFHPDDEALITCCDGSNKYPPVTAGQYLAERFSDSYGRS